MLFHSIVKQKIKETNASPELVRVWVQSVCLSKGTSNKERRSGHRGPGVPSPPLCGRAHAGMSEPCAKSGHSQPRATLDASLKLSMLCVCAEDALTVESKCAWSAFKS